jgi:hypothetical protein
LFPGVDHREQPADFYVEFFERNRGTPTTPPPKPLLYGTAIANVSCEPGRATALSLVNSIDGITARAEVRIFGEGFSTPLATVPVTLSRGGRREIDICRDSQGNAEAGWVKIGADSGYLAGRARFSSPAREQGSLVANAGLTGGVLAGLRDAATSRINLANPGDTPVVVRLFAHDAAGNELAQTIFEVGANAKVAGTVGAIFGKAAPGVSHVRFEARGRIAAALVNVAADGTLLEVLPSFRHYAR